MFERFYPKAPVAIQNRMVSGYGLATAAFVLLHVLFLLSLVLGSGFGSLAAAGGIAFICVGSSFLKYRHQAVRVILHNALVYWFYYLGRALALFPGATRAHASRSRS